MSGGPKIFIMPGRTKLDLIFIKIFTNFVYQNRLRRRLEVWARAQA
jgi:hypothetical protein